MSVLQMSQVELARYERQQSRKVGALPQAEALLLAAQQAEAIYSQAFQELALQVKHLRAFSHPSTASSDTDLP